MEGEDVLKNIKLTLFFVLLLAAIIIPLIIIGGKKSHEKNFPGSKDIKINEKTISTNESVSKIKYELNTDDYFKKFVMAGDYNYANIRETTNAYGLKYTFIPDGYLSEMIRNLSYNYQLSNTRYLTKIDKEKTIFCMSKKRAKQAFEELYYTETGMYDFMDYVPGYIDYVSKLGSSYCFNYGNVITDNDVLIGVNNVSVSDKDIITTEVYIYEYYSMGSEVEKMYSNKASELVNSGDYYGARNIVLNNLNGFVKHKKIVFRINDNPKFFEYQLLYSAEID